MLVTFQTHLTGCLTRKIFPSEKIVNAVSPVFSAVVFNLLRKIEGTLLNSNSVCLLKCTVRYGTVRYGAARYGTVCYGAVRYGTVGYGAVRYGTLRCGTVRYGAVRYDTVRCGTVRYGTVRYGAVRYGTVRAFN